MDCSIIGPASEPHRHAGDSHSQRRSWPTISTNGWAPMPARPTRTIWPRRLASICEQNSSRPKSASRASTSQSPRPAVSSSARMKATPTSACRLPKVHIACMGIEKIIPRAADLGVYLRLLARSATGQPITTYSSHFHGPRPGGELHIVLVDNKRSELLGSGDFRRSLNCIRCGACFNTCPVYRRSGGHSYGVTVGGPIGSIINAAREPREHKSLPFACSLCGSCSDVCPVKIDLHQQLFISRRQLAILGLVPKSKQIGLKDRRRGISVDPGFIESPVGLARLALRVSPRALTYSRLNIWGRQRELPPPPHQTFREIYAARQSEEIECMPSSKELILESLRRNRPVAADIADRSITTGRRTPTAARSSSKCWSSSGGQAIVAGDLRDLNEQLSRLPQIAAAAKNRVARSERGAGKRRCPRDRFAARAGRY